MLSRIQSLSLRQVVLAVVALLMLGGCAIDLEDLGGDVGRAASAVEGYADDGFEENDALEEAVEIDPGEYLGLQVYLDDSDFYAVELEEGENLNVSLSFSHAEGNVNLVLFDPSGTRVTGSWSWDDDESISWTAAESGLHVIRVTLIHEFGTSPGNEYDMEVRVDDRYEENDTVETAAPVWPGTRAGLRLFDGDDDYYSIYLETGDEISVDLDFVHRNGDHA